MKFLNSTVAHILPYMPKTLVGLVSKKYISGETIDSAIAIAKQMNEEGITCTIDLLGEFVTSQQEVDNTVHTYKQVLDKISQENINSTISIKPTSFGALIDKKLCFKNIQNIIECAASKNNSVAIDMEDHPYTDFTLDTYAKLKILYPDSVTTVIQAYLKRTIDDAQRLTESDICNFRLCKGIYQESETISYKNKQKINENYLEILELLFKRKTFVGIATHDDYLVDGATALIEKHSIAKDEYEFQMLLGVRNELRKKIVAAGHPLRIYIPFGKKWYEYSLRRLKENPDIVGHVIKGVITLGR